MDKYSEFENDFLNADDSLLGITDDAVADKAHLYPIFQQISDRTERYRDFLFLGKGGEKSVSSAYDRIVERRIAMARPKVSDDMDCNEAFLREARITAFLDHPNIMPVHSIAIDDTGPYFTMECISGDSLSQLRARLCHHSLSVSVLFELLDVFERVCDAIAYAHSRGVLHLDLKPENIQVGSFGNVLVIDWGLAQVIDCPVRAGGVEKYCLDSDICNDITLLGKAKGTPGFMSPAQTLGAELSFSDDVYALGSILYYILTGLAPVDGDSNEQRLRETREGGIIKPSSRVENRHISTALEAIAMKALSLDSTSRYQSVNELKHDITQYRLGFATEAEGAGFSKQLQLLFLRHKNRSLMILFFVTFLGLLSAEFIYNLNKSRLLAESAQKSAEYSLTLFEREQEQKEHIRRGALDTWHLLSNELQSTLSNRAELQHLFFEVGRSTFLQENYIMAIQILETAAANAKGKSRDIYLRELGYVLFITHDFEAAEDVFKKVVAGTGRNNVDDMIELSAKCKVSLLPNTLMNEGAFTTIVNDINPKRGWLKEHFSKYYKLHCQQ